LRHLCNFYPHVNFLLWFGLVQFELIAVAGCDCYYIAFIALFCPSSYVRQCQRKGGENIEMLLKLQLSLSGMIGTKMAFRKNEKVIV
jgi:hypothetical protein